MNSTLSDTMATISDVASNALDVLESATDSATEMGATIAAASTPLAASNARTGVSLLRRYKLALLGAAIGYGAWRWWSSDDNPSKTASK